jgi:Tol biopolymer transport system component
MVYHLNNGGEAAVMKIPLYVVSCLAIIIAACSPASRKSDQYRIAFVPEATGQHGIFVVNSDRTGGKLLTPDETAQLRFASWSPDGKKIAFFASRNEDAPIRLKYRLPLHYPLYLMNSSGGGQKRLLDFPVSSFEWSPDSRQLLLVSAYEDPGQNDPNVLKGLKAPMSAIYLMNLQTGSQRRITGFGQQCSGNKYKTRVVAGREKNRLCIICGQAWRNDVRHIRD